MLTDDSRIPTLPPLSYKLQLDKFIREDKSQLADIVLFDKLENLLRLYIEQELSASSDVLYNMSLVKSIIALFDVTELRTCGNEYVLRKYIRSILKTYVSEINKVRKIMVKDKAKFGVQMEYMGLNIGFSPDSSSRSFFPDGNVLVLSLLVMAIIFLTRKN